MFYLLIILTSLINGTFILFINHPLAMGMSLLIQTILICLMTGLSLKTFWFSYILFLIFLGGLLVLFIYVTSLASNEIFKFSKKNILFLTFSNFLSIFLMTLTDKTFLLINFFTADCSSNGFMANYFMENSLILSKLFNYPINMMTIILMIYLFLTLVVAVKITNIFEGPLRPKL